MKLIPLAPCQPRWSTPKRSVPKVPSTAHQPQDDDVPRPQAAKQPPRLTEINDVNAAQHCGQKNHSMDEKYPSAWQPTPPNSRAKQPNAGQRSSGKKPQTSLANW
jgi:hypothetical protein